MSTLSLTTLPSLSGRPGLLLPQYDVAGLGVGIVHLGAGAFHRAHQAVLTEDCLGDGQWGICAFTQRSDTVVRALAPQDGLFTLLERGRDAGPARVVGTIREIRSAPHDPAGVAARIADPRIRVVTLTVTEKGYRPAADSVRSDLDGFALPGYRPRTVVGQLAAGLDRRRRQDAGPLSILPCDNVIGNGAALRRSVGDFCALLPSGDGLADWIGTNVAFPSSVVDRIVPAAADADRAEAQRLLGCSDNGTVIAESFRQWVIEDDFAAPRPAWQDAGAVLTADVRPYERMKLRLLNATHSLIAYTGALAGYPTIADALTDQGIAEAASSLMAYDAAPGLTAPEGVDPAAYQRTVLNRLADPSLAHDVEQVAADGSVKVPIRLFATIRHRLGTGSQPYWAALAVAAWMVYVARRGDTVRDPRSGELARAVAGRTTAAGLVTGLLAVRSVFPEDLAADPTFRALLEHHAARLLAQHRRS